MHRRSDRKSERSDPHRRRHRPDDRDLGRTGQRPPSSDAGAATGADTPANPRAQLAHANRLAILGELNASIAHEVNQPLAAIAVNASTSLRWLVRPNPDLGKAIAALRMIVEEVHRASAMVQRIRTLATDSEPQMSKLDVNDVVDGAVALLEQEGCSRGVSIRVDRAALPAVHGDLIQLQQVIMNLVVNAIQATAAPADRACELVIRTRQYDAHSVMIAVEDAGIGTDAEDLEELFRPFHSTKPNGMGIGLAISRAIIEAHHGRIWAMRNHRAGMTFQFTVPTYRPGAKLSPPRGVAS
jgi:C4-dicarboxylate-specific signal transduction histidine kinase